MKSLLSLIFASCMIFAVGCSTRTAYMPVSGAPEISPESNFRVGEITDRSGFVFPPDEDETIVLEQAMRGALLKALAAKGALDDKNAQWTIAVEITEYRPGNAFRRWLVPGMGATRLSAVASVSDGYGRQAARISVSRNIGAGGGYTVGAWKYVFDEVAEEIVDALTDPGKRKR
jgi:hypothetical protein